MCLCIEIKNSKFQTLTARLRVFLSVLQFVSSGGLQLLLEIFNSGILEPKDQESWTVVREGNPQGLYFGVELQPKISFLDLLFCFTEYEKDYSCSDKGCSYE